MLLAQIKVLCSRASTEKQVQNSPGALVPLLGNEGKTPTLCLSSNCSSGKHEQPGVRLNPRIEATPAHRGPDAQHDHADGAGVAAEPQHRQHPPREARNGSSAQKDDARHRRNADNVLLKTHVRGGEKKKTCGASRQVILES